MSIKIKSYIVSSGNHVMSHHIMSRHITSGSAARELTLVQEQRHMFEDVRYKVCHGFHNIGAEYTVHILAACYETDVGSPYSLLDRKKRNSITTGFTMLQINHSESQGKKKVPHLAASHSQWLICGGDKERMCMEVKPLYA